MTLDHWIILLHPIVAIVFVLPLVGIVSHFAWQTRQRRLKTMAKEKTKIPATAGLEHVTMGRWLASSVLGVALLGITHPIIKNIVTADLLIDAPFQVVLIGLMYVATVASLILLYRAKPPVWRGLFAALTSIGLIVLGYQDGVFRRENEWFISHFFYGTIAAILMVISVAILPEIYKSKQWRNVHICLNAIAFCLFVGLGITGARDLFEIAFYMTPGS